QGPPGETRIKPPVRQGSGWGRPDRQTHARMCNKVLTGTIPALTLHLTHLLYPEKRPADQSPVGLPALWVGACRQPIRLVPNYLSARIRFLFHDRTLFPH